MLSRDQILSCRPRFRDINVSEWGGDVRVQEMSVATRVAFLEVIRANLAAVETYTDDQDLPESERTGVAPVDKLDQAIVTIIYSIVDEAGEHVFSMDDYAEMRKLSAKSIFRLWDGVAELAQDVSADTIETEKKS